MPQKSAALLIETMDELLRQLGGISPKRVRLKPTPGKATERDLIRLNDRHDHLYELVDGTLVEKVVSSAEAYLAFEILFRIRLFLETLDLGMLMGADGALRLMPGLVRIPDGSFVRWERLPVRGQVPSEPIASLVPDLAIEVLSKGNTRGEMQRKLREYFLVGVQVVWYIDPKKRLVQVHTAPDRVEMFTEEQTLTGGELLPGLVISLKQLFARLPPPSLASRTKRRSRNKP